MKNTGLIRKVDELGRIVIPIEIRNNMGIKEKDTMEIFMQGKDIFIQKATTDEKGMTRVVDELGRIVIPIEIRNELELIEKSPLEVHLDGKRIILKKYYSKCIFCEKEKDLYKVLGKPICKKCMHKIVNETNEFETWNLEKAK